MGLQTTIKRVRLRRLAEAQNWRCCYCGIPFMDDGTKQQWNIATLEHVRPLGYGGTFTWINEVAACRLCNTGRDRMACMKYFLKVIELGRWKAFRWAIQQRKTKTRERIEAAHALNRIKAVDSTAGADSAPSSR